VNDLDTPRKRKRYWKVSQQTVVKYRKQVKNLHSKNYWLRKRVKNLTQLVDHLKNEQKISDGCYSILKVIIYLEDTVHAYVVSVLHTHDIGNFHSLVSIVCCWF